MVIARPDDPAPEANGKSASVALEGEGWRHQRNIATGDLPDSTSLPRSGDINGLLYAGERRTGERGLGPEMKRKEKGKKVGGFVGRLRQGVRIQDALGVRDQHLVPRWVRSRADYEPVAHDEGHASAAVELSEERRVGSDGRCRWSPYHYKIICTS